MRKVSFLTFLVLAVAFSTVYAQEEGGTGSEQAPWFYYWPQEDADNFNYSTMGTTNVESSQAGSSLGQGQTNRRSNLEVNQPTERPQNTQPDNNAVDEYIAEVESIKKQGSPPAKSGGSNMYKWVDGNGEIHVTNNPNNIPEEYKDQVSVR